VPCCSEYVCMCVCVCLLSRGVSVRAVCGCDACLGWMGLRKGDGRDVFV